MSKLSTLLIICAALFFSSNSHAYNSNGNFRVSPAGLLLGAVNLELDIAIDRRLSIGPMYTYWDFEANNDFKALSQAYGVRMDWHQNRFNREGMLYGVYYKHWTVDAEYLDDNDDLIKNNVAMNMLGFVGGYRWMWDSFNVTTEVGYRLIQLDGFKLKVETGENTKARITDISVVGALILDVTVGWAF